MLSQGKNSTGKAKPRCDRCVKVVVIISMIEAVAFTVLKVALGLSCGSRALIAASLYSVQDFVSSLVAAIGLKVSARPPDHNHPYGHGKVEYVVVAGMSMMILLGIVALAITSLAGLFGQAEVAEPPTLLALWVALVCGVSCWLLSKFQGCAGARLNSPALKSCSMHMHGDYIASIAVVVSVIGAKLGYPALDHIVAVFEAVHVVYVSGRMLGSAVNGLMDSTADDEHLERLLDVIEQTGTVKAVRRVAARWVGQKLIAQVVVEVPGETSVTKVDEIHRDIGRAVKRDVCKHSETFVRVLPVPTPPGDGGTAPPTQPDIPASAAIAPHLV